MASIASTLSQFYFSPDIPDLQLATSEKSVLKIAALSNGGRGGSVLVFQTTYYPNGGIVTFRDLRSIVEAYMQQKSLSVQLFRIKYGTEVQDTTIIFSRTKVFGFSAEEFLIRSFLTTQHARLTSAEAKEYLYYYVPYPEGFLDDEELSSEVNVNIQYRLTYMLNGETTTIVKNSSADVSCGMNTCAISMNALHELFGSLFPTQATALSLFVGIDDKGFSFYITQKVGQNEFYFRNNFNCYELAIIPSAITTKTETECSTAICCDQMIQYDIEHTQTFEVQSAQLLLSHAKWLTEMLTSPEIRLNNRIAKQIKKMPQILIVDYDSELTDAPGEGNSVKFEWQYASRDMATFMEQVDYGIFTKEYTEQYE